MQAAAALLPSLPPRVDAIVLLPPSPSFSHTTGITTTCPSSPPDARKDGKEDEEGEKANTFARVLCALIPEELEIPPPPPPPPFLFPLRCCGSIRRSNKATLPSSKATDKSTLVFSSSFSLSLLAICIALLEPSSPGGGAGEGEEEEEKEVEEEGAQANANGI